MRRVVVTAIAVLALFGCGKADKSTTTTSTAPKASTTTERPATVVKGRIFARDRNGCSGVRFPIDEDTPIVVTNKAGKQLAEAKQTGETSTEFGCNITFSVQLHSDEEGYVIAVGDYGEVAYNWSQLTKDPGPEIILGG